MSYSHMPGHIKLFKILVELCDNISRYAGDDSGVRRVDPIGKIVLEEYSTHFITRAVNPVNRQDWFTLVGKCTKINLLDRDGLKKMRIKYRSQNTKTGNIGLINVALISKNPIFLERIEKEDGFVEASFKIRLNKDDYGKPNH